MYIKFQPSQYIFRYRSGKLISEGIGLSFFFLERNTSVCAVPVAGQDADFMFEEVTCDFQKVTVQGQLTYKIMDYAQTAGTMDFSINLKTKQYFNDPMPKLAKRMINIAESFVKSRISTTEMTQAVQSSLEVSADVFAEMQKSPELKNLGIAVTGFSILKISANSETARALEAATREEILRQSDDALYERRNASIEQERRVKENELNTEIKVEEKKKTIRETEIQTKQMMLEKENQLEEIRLDAEIRLEQKRQELAELKFQNAKKEADAEAYRINALMQAYSQLSPETLVALATLNMNPETIIAQAFEKLAVNSDKIGTLSITPDLLESLGRKKD